MKPTTWFMILSVALIPAAGRGQQTAVNGNVQVNGSVALGLATGPAPTITNVSPASGPVGDLVTITGTNFGAAQGASTVLFSGVPATPALVWSATSFAAVVPNGATSGPLTISVNGNTVGVAFTVAGPVITGVSVSSGTVTISGSGFGTTQGTVALDGTQVGTGQITGWTDTSITVNAGVTPGTTNSVVVTHAGTGGLSTTPASFFAINSAGC